MATVKYNGITYDCAQAFKGPDYVRLVDANGCMTTCFEGVSDFSGFEVSGCDWSTPAADTECYIAVVHEDGTVGKSKVRLCDPLNGMVDQNTGSTIYGWSGTSAEFNAQKDSMAPGTLCIITDAAVPYIGHYLDDEALDVHLSYQLSTMEVGEVRQLRFVIDNINDVAIGDWCWLGTLYKSSATDWATFTASSGYDYKVTTITKSMVNGTWQPFRFDAVDFVVAQGTTAATDTGETWEYRRWNSGMVEAWCTTVESDIAFTKDANSNLYYCGFLITLPDEAFPQSYIREQPYFNASVRTMGYFFGGYDFLNNHKTVGIRMYSFEQKTTATIVSRIYVHGRWK